MPNFIPFNPEQRALELRPQMFETKNGIKLYRLTNMSKTDQRADTEIWGHFFRPRDYIKIREYSSEWTKCWLTATVGERWSPIFLGLDENGIQKLEFQNPGYVAALRLGGDPRDYNRVFGFQVSGCNYCCSFCYVSRVANDPTTAPSGLFSASHILESFLSIVGKQGAEAIKVIRLSGGEVTSIVPEMIIDISDQVNKRGLSEKIYFFADCNLSTIKISRRFKSKLKEVAQQKNFGMIGCLKAIGDGSIGQEEFTLITGASSEHFEKQFEALNFYVNDVGADFYLYLLPIVSGDQREVKEKLQACFNRLREIDENLPLRTNMLNIALERYKETVKNLKEAENEGRKLPDYDEKLAFHIWYKDILPKVYPSSILKKYRCQIPVGETRKYAY